MSDRPTPDDFRAKVFRDREHIGDWRVEKLNDDGESYDVAIFSGAQARERAIRYADREYAAFDEIELEPHKRLTEDQIAAELSELWSALQAIREAVEELAPPQFCAEWRISRPRADARGRGDCPRHSRHRGAVSRCDLLTRLDRWHVTGRVAIADTIGTAWAVVRLHPPCRPGVMGGEFGTTRVCFSTTSVSRPPKPPDRLAGRPTI